MARWLEGTAPTDPASQAAHAALDNRLKRAWEALRGAVDDPADEEAVHQARVASRRAQAALDVFAEFLPTKRGRHVRKQVKRIRCAAGEARDLDVFAARFERLPPSAEDFAPLLAQLAELRLAARAPIEAALKKLRRRRFRRQMRDLLRRVRWRAKRNGRPAESYREFASRALAAQAEVFAASARGPLQDCAALHQLRIAGKRLRYGLELLGHGLEPQIRESVYPQLERLQERLGEVNDHAAAAARLREWAATWPAEQAALAQTLLEREQRALDEAVGRFLASWTPGQAERIAGPLLALQPPPLILPATSVEIAG